MQLLKRLFQILSHTGCSSSRRITFELAEFPAVWETSFLVLCWQRLIFPGPGIPCGPGGPGGPAIPPPPVCVALTPGGPLGPSKPVGPGKPWESPWAPLALEDLMGPVCRQHLEVQLVLESHYNPWALEHPLGQGHQFLVVLGALVPQYRLYRLAGQALLEVRVVQGDREVRVARLPGAFLFRCYPPKGNYNTHVLILLLFFFWSVC